ncbi:MAG: hypothetical protein OXC01_18980 [Immundisolibacterales bacterium]|nr:hypothetical protein [Immundisolibacterales bacterium]
MRRPGWTGGCVPGDELELEWIGALPGRDPAKRVERVSALDLAGSGVHRAEWRDGRVREAERARQFPAPPAGFPFPSGKDIAVGDRLWRTEVAGPDPAAPERPPATTETDIPDSGVSVAPFPLRLAAHSRMVPRSPWSAACISPRLSPGVSTMRSISPLMASAASSRSRGSASASASRSIFRR